MKRCLHYATLCLVTLVLTAGTSAFAAKSGKGPKSPAKKKPPVEKPADKPAEKPDSSAENAETPAKEAAGEPAADAAKAETPADASAAKSAEAPAENADKPAEGADSTAKQPVEASKEPAAAKPVTHKVAKSELKIEVSLDGIFEARKTAEISLEPEVWSALKVLSAVRHGSEVKRGDPLVTLELDKIDRAIDDLRTANKSADLAIKLAERQQQTLEKSTPMDLAANQQNRQMAHEDQNYYLKVDRPMSLKAAEFMLKSSQENYDYQLEEVRQLEKMYKADDLTEETEEIILQRARNALEYAEFSLERAKVYHQRTMEVTIPRHDTSNKEAIQRVDLQAGDVKTSLPLALLKQRMDLDKLKRDRDRSEESLEKLVADRASMIVKAPVSGVVYYGKCVDGKVSAAAAMDESLQPGGSIMPKKVFMTIVQPRPMFIHTTVTESQLQHVRAGAKGTAEPAALPDMKLTAIVESVSAIPVSPATFDSRITVAMDEKADALMPGMTCKVNLVAYLNKEALTVPPKAVSEEDSDGGKSYVYRLKKDGKSNKQYVKVGKRTATQVEIVDGLSEGDEVLLEAPKED